MLARRCRFRLILKEFDRAQERVVVVHNDGETQGRRVITNLHTLAADELAAPLLSFSARVLGRVVSPLTSLRRLTR